MTLIETAARPTARAAQPRTGWDLAHGLAMFAAFLMVVASLGGLFFDGFYTDGTWARSAFRGNDLATLLVAAPLLAGGAALSASGSRRGRVVTIGMLGYGVYNYAFYAYGAAWSDWFLLHVLALVVSGLGLVLLVSGTKPSMLAVRTPYASVRRAVAAYTALVGLVLGGLWTFMSLRYAITGALDTGTTPRDAMHLVFALDLSLMVPALLAAAILLWRRHAWGVPMAAAVNVAGAAYQVALAAGAQFQANAGISGKSWFSAPALFVFAGSIASAVAMLRHVREG